ncbi:MAG: hypothetical protein H7Y20_10950 [Bryobacteraceae bacterium]|nr:hypothetical protein [Bryobacteraceae bacterium]
MTTKQTKSSGMSRRRLFAMTGFSAGALMLARHALFADEEGIVPTMVNAAAKAKISIQPIRHDISVLEGSGGNIAVLTGKDGQLLVDAGFTVSRPGYSATDRALTRRAQPGTINHLCGGPSGIIAV